MTTGLPLLVILSLASCSLDNPVKEYFEMHGQDYPADVSGLGVMGMRLAGVDRDELMEPGAREFVEEGMAFIKIYLMKKKASLLVPGTVAIAASKPVFFRGESGEVGLMVKVEAYGNGTPDPESKVEVQWMGEKKRFWKVVNFAYFNRNEIYQWQFGGWVY